MVEELEPIHFWHHEVEQDECGVEGLESLEGEAAVGGGANVPAFFAQCSGELIAGGVVVFDDEDETGFGQEAESFHDGAEALPVDGFGQIIGDAEGHAHFAIIGHGDEDNRDVGGSGVGLEFGDDRPSVHAWHHDIGGDGHRLVAAGQLQPLRSVGGGQDIKPFFAQIAFHQIEHSGIIIDDDDGWAVGDGDRGRGVGASDDGGLGVGACRGGHGQVHGEG